MSDETTGSRPTPDAASGSAAVAGSFRFACEDCAHFVVERGACANGYPNAAHRRGAPRVTFCKEFELS